MLTVDQHWPNGKTPSNPSNGKSVGAGAGVLTEARGRDEEAGTPTLYSPRTMSYAPQLPSRSHTALACGLTLELQSSARQQRAH